MLNLTLSIITVTYNSAETIANFLKSIFTYPPKIPFELIIIDNASGDKTCQILDEWQSKLPIRVGSSLKLVLSKENLGFAKACNLALKEFDSAFVLFLNPDIEIIANFFENLLAFMDKHPDAAAVAPQLLNPDGSIQIGFNVRSLANLSTAFYQLLLLHRIFPQAHFTKKYYLTDWSHNELRQIEQPAAAAILFRNDVFKKIGLLDEQFFLFFEDVDLCRRILQNNLKIYYLPTAKAFHSGGSTIKKEDPSKIALYYHKSRLKYYRKYNGVIGEYTVRVLIFIGMLLRMLSLGICLLARKKPNQPGQNVNWDNPRESLKLYWIILKECFKKI